MQNEPRVTMVSPASGFTSRVMARLAERERIQARRRAFIGAAMLVIAMAIVLALVIAWLVSWISMLTHPQAISPMLVAFATLLGGWSRLIQGVVIALTVILQNLGELPLVVYACIVLAMTAVWVQVVTGSFQRILTLRMGGSR